MPKRTSRSHPSRIDYRLRPRGSGLVMQLVPRAAGIDAADPQVFVSESAFGFVEPSICACWPAYSGYAHWGWTEIPVDAWRRIVVKLAEVQQQLLAAATAVDIAGLGFMFENIRLAFQRDFQRMRPKIVQMISDLIAWLVARFARCTHIAIWGI